MRKLPEASFACTLIHHLHKLCELYSQVTVPTVLQPGYLKLHVTYIVWVLLSSDSTNCSTTGIPQTPCYIHCVSSTLKWQYQLFYNWDTSNSMLHTLCELYSQVTVPTVLQLGYLKLHVTYIVWALLSSDSTNCSTTGIPQTPHNIHCVSSTLKWQYQLFYNWDTSNSTFHTLCEFYSQVTVPTVLQLGYLKLHVTYIVWVLLSSDSTNCSTTGIPQTPRYIHCVSSTLKWQYQLFYNWDTSNSTFHTLCEFYSQVTVPTVLQPGYLKLHVTYIVWALLSSDSTYCSTTGIPQTPRYIHCVSSTLKWQYQLFYNWDTSNSTLHTLCEFYSQVTVPTVLQPGYLKLHVTYIVWVLLSSDSTNCFTTRIPQTPAWSASYSRRWISDKWVLEPILLVLSGRSSGQYFLFHHIPAKYNLIIKANYQKKASMFTKCIKPQRL